MSENNGIKEPLNKNNKVPKLRFPSFKDDWKKTLIEDICTNEKYSFTGGPFGSNLKVGDYTQSGVRVIQLNNINDIYFNDDNKVFVSVEKADSLKSCNAYSGDLIFAKMMPAGRLCILPKTYDRYLLGSDAIRLKPNIDKYYCFFLLECLNRTIIRNSITSKTSGSTRQRIGLLDLKKTSFYCPNYIEQKQIGLFFELIEFKISNISKKINILKKYKEGVFRMIQINASNCIKLGDFCDLYQPKTIAQSLLKINGKYPVYGANGIIGYYNNYNHETSQVIVGCRGNCGAIQLTNNKSWINGNAMVIKPLNNIKLIYLYYLMHTIRFDKIIEKSSVPQITRDKMKTIKIPANFDNRILDMLIFLDKKIELLQKEVKVLIKIKLQLLNILFI